MVDADRGVWQIDEEHARTFFGLRHDDADARTLCAGDEGLAAVDDPMIAVGTACRLHHRRVGPRAAFLGRLGHENGRSADHPSALHSLMSIYYAVIRSHKQHSLIHTSYTH